jgi:two-component sensor histidine kinase
MNLQCCMANDTPQPLQPLFLVEEITHRVLNEYAEAISTLALAARGAPDRRSELTLRSAASRLQAHAEAHRALQAPAFSGLTHLGNYVAQLCSCLSRAQLAANGVQLTVSAGEVWLDTDRSWRVGLIVAELVRNAARHGFAGGPGAIRVEIFETARRVVCQVSDDGHGPASAGGGRGRPLIQALAAELAGEVEWTFTPAGCRARLEFARPGDARLAAESN